MVECGVIEPLPRVYNRFDMMFFWANTIMSKGAEPGRRLCEADINDTDEHDIPRVARDALQSAWNAQINAGKRSLTYCLMRVWWELGSLAAFFHLLEMILNFVSPVLIKNIVHYVDAEEKTVAYGAFLAVAFFATPFLQNVLSSHFICHGRRLGFRAQGATCCMVFEKVLRLSQPAAASYGPGALMNIMQVDSFRFQFSYFHLNFVWSMPLMLILGVCLLYQNLGFAAFTPLVVMASMYPLNMFLVRRLMDLSRNVNKARDARIKVLTEVIHAARLVKMLAWEHQISDLVAGKRSEEMTKIARLKLFDIGNGLVWQGVPSILPLVTFGVYVLAGGRLDPGLVFSSLALVDLVRVPMNLFPQALTVLTQVRVGIERIETLLLAEEMHQLSPMEAEVHEAHGQARRPTYVRSGTAAWSAEVRSLEGQDAGDNVVLAASDHGWPVISRWSAGPVVSMVGASFRWATSTRTEGDATSGLASNVPAHDGCLRRCCSQGFTNLWRRSAAIPLLGARGRNDVEHGVMVSMVDGVSLAPSLRVHAFEVARGKLVMVVGPVGAGKSTMMAGLLNEVPQLSGRVGIQGPVAFCAQVPWIMHGTVLDNVLLGSLYDEDRFKESTHACALDVDLEELSNGPQTVIGERGINLSGGQKARISLARATYKHPTTDLYIFDDPLSAVDMHVAKHLMEECLGSTNGLLRNKTRILVTHQIQFMHNADLVAVLKGGEIVTCRPPRSFSSAELESYGLQLPPATSAMSAEETPALQSIPTLKKPESLLPGPLPFARNVSNTSDMGVAVPTTDCIGVLPWRGDAWSKPGNEGAAGELDLGGPVSVREARRRMRHPLFRGRNPFVPLVLERAISESDTVRSDLPPPPHFKRAVSSPLDSGSANERSDTLVQPTAIAPSCARGDEEASTADESTERSQAADHTADDEDRQVGALSLRVWCTYGRAMGPVVASGLITAYLLTNLTQLGSTFWMAHWSSSPQTSAEETLESLAIYALLSFGTVTVLCCRLILFRFTSLRVSHILHKQALWAVLRAPMSWLDTTHTGRIINRFSQDMQKLDMELQGTTSFFTDNIVNLSISIIVIGIYMPVVIIIVLPMLYFYNLAQSRFRRTARELQRMSSQAKSPIFQGLDEAIAGVSTIRAYEQQSFFISRNASRCAMAIRLDFCIVGCNRWLGTRMKAIGMVPVAAVVTSMVFQGHIHLLATTITGAAAGLILRYTLQLTNGVEGLLQGLTQMELCLVALERVTSYASLQQEAELALPIDSQLCGWPPRGEICFDQVTMRFRITLPTVLKSISFTIPGGTSVGVVGRTGAGKSSLLQAIFRMCPLEGGTICIDGQNIWSLGLHTVRRRLAIIPQDPVGFTGSLRFNLDPFGERSDEQLLTELGKVQLHDFVMSKDNGLNYHLSAGGENLSVGQRQLVCAARAFLRQSPILILDEATASVDFQTDALIQEAIRSEASTRKLTTMTIAHRINTILGADNVLVMDKGKVAEFGPTKKLATDPSSIFYTFIDTKQRSH